LSLRLIASTGVAGRSFLFVMMVGLNLESKETIIRSIEGYVHSCRVEDGGYFFARIPPASLLDTYYAVKILGILGVLPQHPDSLKKFVGRYLEDSSGDIHTWYLASEILIQLDEESDLKRLAAGLTPNVKNSAPLSKPDNLYIEVSSELKHIFEHVSLIRNLNLRLYETEIAAHIHSLRNDDGGYGLGRSTLATTCYALNTLNLLNKTPDNPGQIMEFLKSREKGVYFLEDLFYLVQASAILGQEESNPSNKISFVLDCQCTGGGFARARAMGIPTLEYTCYAVSVLDRLSFLNKAKEVEPMK
jgi:hypothetical protein